ncbi:MAG: DUF2017 family protein [Acidimicrobiales bacterium]|nr:DUF2017 family protein [Acidimicrobiales bacterium]MBO0886053.1 DUF2017 family protein [Acidimicrobiales bacterium]MBO0893880.1 DUF2017 family protein [Acidimicrobiales bacterium]
MIRLARIRRGRDGLYRLRLPEGERALLRGLPRQVLELVAAGDPSTRRLFPPAYPDDEEAEAEYRELMRDQLLDHHRHALEIMEETLDADRLDEEQLLAWLSSLNDLRLVIGTRLDVTEDMTPPSPGDPNAPALQLYGYLTWLQATVIDLLAESP